MRRIDFTDVRTRELQRALAEAFWLEGTVRELFGLAGIPFAKYPRAPHVMGAWHRILADFKADEVGALLGVVVARPDGAKCRELVQAFLDEARTEAPHEDRPELTDPIELLEAVFKSRLGAGARRRARELAARLASLHLNGALFDATRLAVEYQLLTAAELSASLIVDLAESRREDRVRGFDKIFRPAVANDVPLREIELRVEHQFFSRTLERREDWATYFRAVARIRPRDPMVATTLFRIRVKGYVVPQYLVAGLLAEFDDDWHPVIENYENQPEKPSPAFASYQASLWNTWLMWGPSIPICGCAEWHGLYAHQFGYGDEDNSLPLTYFTGEHVPFEASQGYPPNEFVGARLSRVVGRLRWVPPGRIDPATSGELDLLPVRLARAQRAIVTPTRRDPDAPRDYARPLLFQGEQLQSGDVPARSYFSAYQWLMFLVARSPAAPGEPPRRLDLEPFPEADDPVKRRGKTLWRDLVPVYVHANIADPKALALQRSALIRTAIATLRQLWHEQEALLPNVVPGELRFHLVGASDFTGCESAAVFAPTTPLIAALRAALAHEEPALREAILLPDDGAPPVPELARFYATCQLPELVDDYFHYVQEQRKP
ncbi:MAG: hypothetical protein KIT31_04575 [Deltaproteobacteria bacterium]|nr:hypothetical protein [Deltaproteobacteria bacterium]